MRFQVILITLNAYKTDHTIVHIIKAKEALNLLSTGPVGSLGT